MIENEDPMAWLDDPRGYLDNFIMENSPPDFVRALYDEDDPYHEGAKEQYDFFLKVAEERMAQLRKFADNEIAKDDIN